MGPRFPPPARCVRVGVGRTLVAMSPRRALTGRRGSGPDDGQHRTSREGVVLSEREARALRRIEQQLTADDPRFAARMSRALPGRPSRWPLKLQSPMIAAMLLSVVVCLAVGVVGAGLAVALLAAPWSGSGDGWTAEECPCAGGG